MRKALGIDVGGTKIYSAIINEKGEILSEIEKYHTPKTFLEIQAIFKEIIEKHEKEVDVIAFSTCGAVNKTNDGILGSTGNIAKEYPTMDFKSLSKNRFLLKMMQIVLRGLNMLLVLLKICHILLWLHSGQVLAVE